MRTYANQPSGTVDRAGQLRRDSTDAEKRMWRALRSSFPEFKWRRQLPIGPYFADLVCFGEKLVIELDGGQHAEAVAYDAARTHYLEAQGYRVIRFGNNDVLGNLDGVILAVASELSSSPSQPSAGPLPLPRERAL